MNKLHNFRFENWNYLLILSGCSLISNWNIFVHKVKYVNVAINFYMIEISLYSQHIMHLTPVLNDTSLIRKLVRTHHLIQTKSSLLFKHFSFSHPSLVLRRYFIKVLQTTTVCYHDSNRTTFLINKESMK